MTNETSFTPSGAPIFKKKSLEADDLRNYLYSWKRAGFTPTQELRVLKLYLGWTEFMDIKGEYPFFNFTNLAKAFHFKSTKDFVEKIMTCDGFCFIWDNQEHTPEHLIAFYSPICIQDDSKLEFGVDYNNNINITKKNIKKNVIIDSKLEFGVENRNSMTKKVGANQDHDYEVKAAIAKFFHFLYTDHYAYLAFVDPVNKKTEALLPCLKQTQATANSSAAQQVPSNSLAAQQAMADSLPVNLATRHFFEYYLGKYFMENGKSFIQTSHEGKKCWLRRVMEKSFTNRNIAHAVDDIRRELNHNAGLLMRQNHKFSQYEYLDTQTQTRLYDEKRPDGTMVQVQIPAGAPPRPNDTATWDNWEERWRNRQLPK